MLKRHFTPRVSMRVITCLAATMIVSGAQAQIVRDATPGQISGTLAPIDGVIEIHGDQGLRRGTNDAIVLHSFDQFNLGANETARYTDRANLINDVTNVLTRVTGGSASQLDGRLESLYPQADLFFVNPNGVFFGANFSIDVPKSFHVSTADRLEWDTAVEIDTAAPTDVPLLTAAIPVAWRFLGAGPEKRIEVDGFSVIERAGGGESSAFTFVGSDIHFNSASVPVQIDIGDRDLILTAVSGTGVVDGTIMNGNELIDVSNDILNSGTTIIGGIVPVTGLQPTTEAEAPGVITTTLTIPNIIRDETPGQTSGGLTPIENVYTIHGNDGTRPDNADLVVHSFNRFNLLDSETARFTDDPLFLDSVRDIVARVTGEQSSQIHGTIENLYTNAELFFVNPNGVIFGPDFTIDTSGSFLTTTADAITFESGASAILGLVGPIPNFMSEPIRWEFLTSGPEKGIIVQGWNVVGSESLDPQQNTFFGFIGTDVTFDLAGPLRTGGGGIGIVAVGSAGGFAFDPVLTREGLGVTPNGNLTFALRGDNTINTTATADGTFGGEITLLGGNVDVTLGAGSSLGTGLDILSGSSASVPTDAADITIIGDTIQFLSQGGTTLSTEGEDGVGSVLIDAANTVSFANDTTILASASSDNQHAGDIRVSAGDLLTGSLTVESGSSGAGAFGGLIELSADTIALQDLKLDTSADASGQPGNITITGRQISLTGQGSDSISTAARDSAFSAGTVMVDASGTLTIADLLINASNTGQTPGDGGFVQIDAASAIADAGFFVDVSSSAGTRGTFTGTAFPSSTGTAFPSSLVRDQTPGQFAGSLPRNGDTYEIHGNDGLRRGLGDSIVIHSFEAFNLGSSEIAEFTDDASFLTSVTNVLTRVTGGASSQLDGIIRSDYANADLFFVNPKGVVFGNGFRIDVPRSFHVSTADTLERETGVALNLGVADDVAPLTDAGPLAWGFVSGGIEKRITIDGFIASDSANSTSGAFTFVGSEIVGGTASSPALIETRGRDFLAAALGGAGTVEGFVGRTNEAGATEFSLGLSPLNADSFGQMDLFTIFSTAGGATNSGDILLSGGAVQLEGQFSTQGGGDFQNGGDVMITASDSLSFDGDISVGGSTGGRGGDIALTSLGSMNLTGQLDTRDSDSAGGGAGDVQFTAAGILTGTDLVILADAGAAGDQAAGDVAIQSDLIRLTDFRISASAGGANNGGRVDFVGRGVLLNIPPATSNNARAAEINSIDVSTSGSGNAGEIVFKVDETLDMQGITLDASNTGTSNGGNGGLIDIVRTPGLNFSADDASEFMISAADPNASDGQIRGLQANKELPDLPPDLTSVEQIISPGVGQAPPPVAPDASFGGGIATQPGAPAKPTQTAAAKPSQNQPAQPKKAASAADPAKSKKTSAKEAEEFAETESSESSEPSSSKKTEEETATETTTAASTEGESTLAETSDEQSREGEDDSESVAELDEDEPEAAVEEESEDASEEETAIPGITLYTRASEQAPRMPRTCAALAKTGSGSRLLAKNPRRRPISSEDWLQAFDQTGDQRLALGGEATVFSGNAANASDPRVEIQQAFAGAAVAIRGDRYDEAADRFRSAVRALEETGDHGGATEALMAFAQLQFQDGRYVSARETLDHALELAEEEGDNTNVAKIRQYLGNALIGVGDLAGAETELTRGLVFVMESEDQGPGASMLNDLGNRHAAKQDFKSALWAYERAAKLARELGRVGDEARAVAGAARVALEVRRLDDAWRLLERADGLRRDLTEPRGRTAVAIHLGHTFSEIAKLTSDRRSDAVRMASSAFEAAARDAATTGDEYSLALANLNLGALYQSEQHRSEALYLTRLARQTALNIDAPELIYRAHWQEGQILWAAHRVRDALASHRRAIKILEDTKPVASTGYGAGEADLQRSVGGVYRDHVDLLLRSSELSTNPKVSQQLIVEARETLEKLKGAELRDYYEDECIASVRKERRSIVPGVAVVHTVILPDRLELLLTLPSGIERFTSKIPAVKLIALVDKFRTEVQNPRSNAYRPLSRRLFELIVAPFQQRLAESGVETLIFVPDGRLRTLPFVALHDGEAFLGDHYATATTLSLNLLSNVDLESEIGAPLFAGLSESVQGFAALESVEDELEQIQDLEGGEVLLNQAFTLDRIKSEIAQQVPGILHLATHAVFTGNPDSSFLLTYSGRVGFDELSDVVGMTRAGGAPLDLLVLSACETAIGNDRAGLGFTGSAIRAGARSAIGSLWPIADEAAQQLMVDFYKNLQSSEGTKANALQEAQALLRRQERYAHPAYWAPFTLVNDWL
jgi:filamentous hemagglutinin family protein